MSRSVHFNIHGTSELKDLFSTTGTPIDDNYYININKRKNAYNDILIKNIFKHFITIDDVTDLKNLFEKIEEIIKLTEDDDDGKKINFNFFNIFNTKYEYLIANFKTEEISLFFENIFSIIDNFSDKLELNSIEELFDNYAEQKKLSDIKKVRILDDIIINNLCKYDYTKIKSESKIRKEEKKTKDIGVLYNKDNIIEFYKSLELTNTNVIIYFLKLLFTFYNYDTTNTPAQTAKLGDKIKIIPSTTIDVQKEAGEKIKIHIKDKYKYKDREENYDKILKPRLEDLIKFLTRYSLYLLDFIPINNRASILDKLFGDPAMQDFLMDSTIKINFKFVCSQITPKVKKAIIALAGANVKLTKFV